MEDSDVYECMEESEQSNGGQKDVKNIEMEGSDVVCNAVLPLRSGDSWQ